MTQNTQHLVHVKQKEAKKKWLLIYQSAKSPLDLFFEQNSACPTNIDSSSNEYRRLWTKEDYTHWNFVEETEDASC